MKASIGVLAAAMVAAVVWAVVDVMGDDDRVATDTVPTPAASPSPVPETPTPTPEAEATPETEPTPGPEPTPEPTPTPRPTTSVCSNERRNYSLEYPVGWYAELEDAEWSCALFDRFPFTIEPETELPAVSIAVFFLAGGFETNRPIVTDPPDALVLEVVDRAPAAGRPTTCVLLEASGAGWFDAGTVLYSCLVDWGPDTLLIEAVDWRDVDFGDVRATVDLMLATLAPLRPLPAPAP